MSIRRAGLAWSVASLILVVATGSTAAEAPPVSQGDAADPVLSDRLFDNITGLNWQFDTSYDVFLPWAQLPPTDESCTPDDVRSLNAVKQLIWRGADSIPLLLAHLDDDRPTQQLITGRAFRDGQPFNPESRFGIPFGTGLGPAWNPRLAQRRDVPFFAIPVGDIAFEALGQIVNRQYKYLGSEGPDHLQTMTSPVYASEPQNPLFAPAALRSLANRGCDDVLLAELASIDPLADPPQWPSLVRLQAIATSKAPGVQERLKQFVRLAKHPQTFMCAVPRQRDRSWDSLVAERAAQLLRNLPENSRDGGTLLHMFLETESEQIAPVVGNYLKTSNPDRAVEVCGHYASGRPVPRELLIPFLEDRSPARNYYPRQTVRERVAVSLGGRLPGFQFQLQWSGEAKDEAIQQLKTRLELAPRTEPRSAARSSR